MSKQQPKIHLALATIMRDIDLIQKNRENQQQGFYFRGIDDVYNHLHPIFAAHGVICLPTVETVTQAEAGRTVKGAIITRTCVTIGWKFIASDGSFLEAKTCGEGLDSADKGTGKACSFAHKTLLLQTFLVPTDETKDGDFYDPTVFPREELAALNKTKERHRYTRRELDMLLNERDAIIKEGKQPSAKLLGDIAEAKLDVEEAESGEVEILPPESDGAGVGVSEHAGRAPHDPTPPASPASKPEKPPKSTEKPKKEATAAPQEPETGKSEAPAQKSDPENWQSHVITVLALKKDPNGNPVNGQRLGDLKPETLSYLRESWLEKHAEKIAAHPEKSKFAELLKRAIAARVK